MSRFVLCLMLMILALGGPARGNAAASAADKPNILLILIDNVGFGDLGGYGNKFVKTPHIDKLAEQGVRCVDFYTGSPSCMPSRGALLTGRVPERTGCTQQVVNDRTAVVLPPTEKLMPAYLKELGYATGCFGKWNLGFAAEPGNRPTERGFDEYLGNVSGNCDYYTHIYNGELDLYRGTEPAHIEGYTTDIVADAACDFIRRHKDRPFFCYVPFNAAHFPNPKNKPPGTPAIWQAPDEYFKLYGYNPDTRTERQRFRAVMSALDAGIGRILKQLDELKLRENTIVVVLSDNGAFMLPGRGMEAQSNRPLKAGGVTLYEGGIRVPCIIRWPARLPGGRRSRELLWSLDLLPMFINAAGGELPSDVVLDGKDPTAALAGEAKSPHPYLYFRWSRESAIRGPRYKLYRDGDRNDWILYDLTRDVGETANVAAEHPEIVDRLSKAWQTWYDGATAEVTKNTKQADNTKSTK